MSPSMDNSDQLNVQSLFLKKNMQKKFNELFWMRINIYLNNYNNRKRIARTKSSKREENAKQLRFQIEFKML